MLLTAPPSSIKVCDEVMFVEKFQIVMTSLTHLYFFILNCVCGNVYMWLQLLESRRVDQGPGAGVMGAVNSNVGAGNWARILWGNSKCSEPLSCLPSTKSLSFYRSIQTLPYIKTNWELQGGGKQCRPYSLRFEFSMLSVSPRDFYAIQAWDLLDLAGIICKPSPRMRVTPGPAHQAHTSQRHCSAPWVTFYCIPWVRIAVGIVVGGASGV